MAVIVWIVEGTWAACIDAARIHTRSGEEILLLHVTDASIAEAAHGAYAGLLGRGHPGQDPGTRVEHLTAAAATELLHAAAERLARPCQQVQRVGRIEREVVTAADGADLLIVARDGDRNRLGPKSLGHHTRFVVDHAPCPVLLIWPDHPPAVANIPPPPPPPRPGRP